LLAFGQAISRTTYSALFTALSTTYGAGDGSTTFNLPDLRGRAAFGKDNMGGTAASRITNAQSAMDGTVLGTVGGDQRNAYHNHSFTGSAANTAGHNADHSHSGNTGNDSPDHSHVETALTNYQTNAWTIGNNNALHTGNQLGNSGGANARHTHGFSTGGVSVDHSHTFTPSGNIGYTGNSNTGNMPPTIILNYIIKT
jgi:microcystin-dependent protein